jgi:hypothetical protein
MNPKNSLIILGIIIIGIVFYIILSSQQPPIVTPEAPEVEAPVIEEPLLSELRTIEISASKAGFSPSSFKVKAEERIILKINYTEKETGHVFSFKDPEVDTRGVTVPGEDIGLPLTVLTTPGEYEFYDEVVDGSREKIIGKMIVE